MKSNSETAMLLKRTDFQSLFTALQEQEYTTIAPTIRDGAIIYDRVSDEKELPVGMTDEQNSGFYRVKAGEDKSLFAYAVGPHSWKKYLHPSQLLLWRANRNGKHFEIEAGEPENTALAFIGVRTCDLQAIATLDRVFDNDKFTDTGYKRRRENIFIVAVQCTEPAGTCFCVSMKTGPRAKSGFDLALTELITENEHYFLVEVGSDKGKEIAKLLPLERASEGQVETALARLTQAASKMGRTLDTNGIKELLYINAESACWQQVAERCLTCANCTLVCPTCFCTTVEDITDLSGNKAERQRLWDSCFNIDFSYVHGGSVRTSASARYRQWLTHKLASWQDQFGTSGCVGCGRCITWCPVGIDITEEVKRLCNSSVE